jgi:hypothetical protein
MDWMILPVDFTGITNEPAPVFRSTTECPYVRWDMIAIGFIAGAVAVYYFKR